MGTRLRWLTRHGSSNPGFDDPIISGARRWTAFSAALVIAMIAIAAASAAAIAAEGVTYVPPDSEAPTNEAWTPCAPATKGHAECELIVAPPKAAEVPGYEYEGSAPGGGVSAAELRSAYKLPEHGGAGNIVAIVNGEGDPNAQADLEEYRKSSDLSECTETNGCFEQLNEKGEPHKPTSTGWSGEISLDLDMVSAACPECHIVLLEAAGEERGLLEADETAVKKIGAVAVSNSWNLGFEANNPANATYCESKGKPYCVSEKEEEEDDLFLDHPGTPILFAGGDYGYAVRYPAVSQYVISVGGTALQKESNSRGWAEEVWFNSKYGVNKKGRGTGSGCSVYEPKPKFEEEYSSDKPCTKNIEEDVAADAAPETGVAVYDSYDGGWAVFGGTSASSPFVAGVEGLSSSYARSLGAETMWLDGAAKELFDVTVGHNGTCTPPTEDEYWCTAGIGYDGPTGNGTPDGEFNVPKHPTVTSVSPNEGPEAGGTSVTITGTNFSGATAVKFGATEAAKYEASSETSIVATAPSHVAGAVEVTVTTPYGTSGKTSADEYAYRSKPTVTNVQPDAGPASGGTTVMISGAGLGGATEVKFGETIAASYMVISETWISAVSPAGSGTVDVTVAGAGGTSATGSADDFTYHSTGIALGWGDNSVGELGDGTTGGPEKCGSEACSRIPVAVSGPLSEVTQISAGEDHGLALLSGGTVKAWGGNAEGELGNGTTTSSDTPVAVSGLTEATAVAAGYEFSLALQKNGTVKAWGYNADGQLGDGKTKKSDTPVSVSGLSEVVAIAAGENHSLALLKNGTVMAWGDNAEGQLGDGKTKKSDTPVAVSGLSEVVAISAGGEDSLAVLKNGTVRAWGYNDDGQLGNGTTTSSDTPVAVSDLSEVVSVAAGNAHALALLKSGEVQSWGANQSGQLGDGSCCERSDTPIAVSGLTEATAIAAGYHSLAMLRSGAVEDWGRNSSGQLGDNTNTGPETCDDEESERSCSKTPVAVLGVSEAVSIAGGVNYVLAIGTIP